MRRRIQLFIHRYYENIKLVLLVIILALLGYGLLALVMDNAADDKRRTDVAIDIIKSIERETDNQTKVINRQFQALCFLLVETSGTDALKQLDPPLEEQCRNLARELKAEERREAARPLQVAPSPSPSVRAPQRGSQTPTQRVQPAANPQPVAPLPQPAQPAAPGLLDTVLAPVDYLVERLRGIL